MTLLLGDTVPNFTQESTYGPIDLYDFFGDGWGILFSHPADFTPVCTTELGAVAGLKEQFDKRNTKVIGLSVDDLASHRDWVKDIEETQNVKLNFPIIADADQKVANLYNMIQSEDNKMTVRSVFIIDPEKKLRLTITYPAATGRNFAEILRVLDSLQLTDGYKVATPANWRDGDDVIVLPAVSNEDADKLFPKGYETVRPYLRTTPQPNK
ncbi:MAG: peroxiredoxin [Chloroflexi bacterium]|nr:peroxiredoxin [Chloroflexota bacterium]MCI0804234.1 peroxiredoxin [Chloroflexota bacterium]MCI0809029.1 peroxiredoxin [Chloroflexota bacterium]MCI0837296.1 peroxiredoxin [Chloroflexota bacterium]MCI0852704.1 peroxiredoxin [Chloroflexota bacterium]